MAIELETEDLLPPLHPGEVLREEFMVPLGLTPYAVAKACRAPASSGSSERKRRLPPTPPFGSGAISA